MSDELPSGFRGFVDRLDGFELIQGKHRADLDNLRALGENQGDQIQELTERVDSLEEARSKTKPVNWITIDDPDAAAAILARLTRWHDKTLPYLEAELLPCWPWHPLLVVEVIALADHYDLAYMGPAPAVTDFLSRVLTTFKGRARQARNGCEKAAHRIDPAEYTTDRALLSEYARWWALERRGTPPGLIEKPRD